ncbi:MAG: hypothetical protein IKY66_02305 [Bacteroidales bacterium]|nr:hypothetical protein [Bacteroidales bacterium]
MEQTNEHPCWILKEFTGQRAKAADNRQRVEHGENREQGVTSRECEATPAGGSVGLR